MNYRLPLNMQSPQESATAFESHDDLDRHSILQRVFDGEQTIVCYAGVSQFQTSDGTGIGRSGCGLAALNCARTLFKKEDGGIRGEQLLHEMLMWETGKVSAHRYSM
jgi:hypothetical protein